MIVRLVAEGDAFALELLQPLTVDLNAGGSRDRRVIPEDVAHVVEQPCGRQHNRGRALLAALYTMVEQHGDACRVLIFGGASPSVLGRMIDLARLSSIAAWKHQLHHASDAELEMLYTHLSNGLMNVVVGGYDKYSREEVISFVNHIVKSSLSLFQ